MKLRGERIIFSATDLNNFLECAHLTHLDLKRLKGEIEWSAPDNPMRDLLVAKGEEHESRYLEALEAKGYSVAIIDRGPTAEEQTLQAMRAGAAVIYQAGFAHGDWIGYADFLIKVDTPSDLGAWSYEVGDTKLARKPKPYYLLQLCFYSEHVARLQGTAPELMHLILGDGAQERYRIKDFDAYFRRARAEFLTTIADASAATYPFVVRHCEICDWSEYCKKRREDDDHLSLVATIRRSQIIRLNEAGITTLEALAEAPEPIDVHGVSAHAAGGLHLQAVLQLHHRRTGEHVYEILPPEGPERGFALLPEASDGDVFFDMEGDPWFENGALEYLFGAVVLEHGEPAYKQWWAHTHEEERAAFEGFVDFLMERLNQYPNMHVYHYAFYEQSALKRLMGSHATREIEVDHLLRSKVFVDLYKVVRQSLRVSQPGYSIKKLEAFYMDAREQEIKGGAESILEYEKFIDSRDPVILEHIREYNEVDCRSTLHLRDWLLERSREAEKLYPDGPGALEIPPEKEPTERVVAQRAEIERLSAALLDGVPETPELRTKGQQAQWLLAQLLDWHRREEKPEWWALFERMGSTPEELLDDPECIAGLDPDHGHRPVAVKKSVIHRLTFPPQEYKLSANKAVREPATNTPAGTLLDVNDAEGWLLLRRGPTLADQPLPRAIGPEQPRSSDGMRMAIMRFAASVVENGIDGDGPYRALRDVLLRNLPRLRGRLPGVPPPIDADDSAGEATHIVRDLDDSLLFIQGPPGSGKTYTTARVIVTMMREGKRVGISSNSHKAIHNLLTEVEQCAKKTRFEFRGIKKSTADDDGSTFEGLGFIENESDAKAIGGRLTEVNLVAGTVFLFSNDDLDQAFDVLFVDEAGQISLANAAAMGTAARNLVLVGDPMQLGQPTKGSHPPGAAASVLEHLLGDDPTVPPERGLFLKHSWRMHPKVCGFISTVMYEDRLEAHPGNEVRCIEEGGRLGGTGLRFLPVAHEGNVQKSPEEAERIRAEVAALMGKSFTDKDGSQRPLTLEDILVVAPYNAQVNCLRESLPEGARVGTVDKFQGQEAPVVLFSMATSSGDELPRTLEFLFSRNRLNVAMSRAQCLAVLVCSPKLLNVRCRTVDQMRMVNALCRFVEMAT
ncbi:MAG: TM0106 family RecB-like putative nuclease [Actinomycetota bacterium]